MSILKFLQLFFWCQHIQDSVVFFLLDKILTTWPLIEVKYISHFAEH